MKIELQLGKWMKTPHENGIWLSSLPISNITEHAPELSNILAQVPILVQSLSHSLSTHTHSLTHSFKVSSLASFNASDSPDRSLAWPLNNAISTVLACIKFLRVVQIYRLIGESFKV